LLLIVSFAFIIVWLNTSLSGYTYWVLGVFGVVYIILAIRKKNFDIISSMKNDLVGLTVLNTIIVLVIMLTGAFSSPLFFLLYFLAFGIAFAYEPGIIFIYIIGIGILLYPEIIKEDQTRNMLMLGSLAIMSLLAFFFGQTYLKKK